jgi:predicted transposase/invertase (TIGR01784 family)
MKTKLPNQRRTVLQPMHDNNSSLKTVRRLLKNLNKFREIPSILQERLFKKLFAIAELSNLNETEMNAYEASLKDKRDWRNAMEYAMTKARKEGIEEGIGKGIEKGRKAEKEEMAKQMKNENFAIDIISRLTGLSIEEINRL